jgi:cellulose synthase/poly-beta-1,6-N-acetylglucosamine synthase-like glycosyltransferase
MTPSALVVWGCVLCIAYAYAGYPLLIMILSRLRPAPAVAGTEFAGSVSLVLTAFNEEAHIKRRIAELLKQLRECGREGELIVVSDGSTDRTAELARTFCGLGVRVLESSVNYGKAAALTLACESATGDVVAFADTRQKWSNSALRSLLNNFSQVDVGAVGGELVLESADGVLANVGLYWRYEKWIRRSEARFFSTVGLSGSIAAVRRSLFRPIPVGVLLDDVYWPLQVVMQGYRVAFDGRALAFDRLPKNVSGEFRRKVRTLSGNFQLAATLPSALVPWQNPVWVQFVSHKLLRLVVPWAFLAELAAAVMHGGFIYQSLIFGQFAFLALALYGLTAGTALRSRAASAAAALFVLNAAAWIAFWVWASGRAKLSWTKTAYGAPGRVPELALRPSADARELDLAATTQ